MDDDFHIKRGETYGVFYSIKKVEVEYYIANYNSFELYERNFINSSNDIKDKQLIGIVGLWTYGKLKRLRKENPYPVLLPVSIKEIE